MLYCVCMSTWLIYLERKIHILFLNHLPGRMIFDKWMWSKVPSPLSIPHGFYRVSENIPIFPPQFYFYSNIFFWDVIRRDKRKKIITLVDSVTLLKTTVKFSRQKHKLMMSRHCMLFAEYITLFKVIYFTIFSVNFYSSHFQCCLVNSNI